MQPARQMMRQMPRHARRRRCLANEPAPRAGHPHRVGSDRQSAFSPRSTMPSPPPTEAQKKLVKLSMDDRDAIVKLIKSIGQAERAATGARWSWRRPRSAGSITRSKSCKSSSWCPAWSFSRPTRPAAATGSAWKNSPRSACIGIVTPVTHSVPTLSANAINMIASGNSMVANAHPSGANCAAHADRRIQQADRRQIRHRRSDHLRHAADAGDGRGSLQSSRHSRCWSSPAARRWRARPWRPASGRSSPGRAIRRWSSMKPPVCKTRPTSIVKGAAYDNNLLCIGEKQVFCVESVFDKLIGADGKWPADSSSIRGRSTR